jgi:hypothetical protein
MNLTIVQCNWKKEFFDWQQWTRVPPWLSCNCKLSLFNSVDFHSYQTNNNNNSVGLVRERIILSERPAVVSEVSAKCFAVRGRRVLNAANPYSRILGFPDRTSYSLFQVAPQFYTLGWVDPRSRPDQLLFRKCGSAGNRTRTSGSVARDLTTRPQRRSYQTYISGEYN